MCRFIYAKYVCGAESVGQAHEGTRSQHGRTTSCKIPIAETVEIDGATLDGAAQESTSVSASLGHLTEYCESAKVTRINGELFRKPCEAAFLHANVVLIADPQQRVCALHQQLLVLNSAGTSKATDECRKAIQVQITLRNDNNHAILDRDGIGLVLQYYGDAAVKVARPVVQRYVPVANIPSKATSQSKLPVLQPNPRALRDKTRVDQEMLVKLDTVALPEIARKPKTAISNAANPRENNLGGYKSISAMQPANNSKRTTRQSASSEFTLPMPPDPLIA